MFDPSVDYGQKNDVIDRHPDVARELAGAFDRWWVECLPLMVNEKVVGPKLNPFAEWYWLQYGGGPTAADYERMDPTRPWPGPAAKGAGRKKKG